MKKKVLTVLLAVCLTAASGSFAFADETAAADINSETATDMELIASNTDAAAADTAVATVDNTKAAVSIKNVKPKLKAASSSYTKIKLSWDKVSGSSGYKVYRATSKNGKYIALSLQRTI